MNIAERVELYKRLFPACKALSPVKQILAKGFYEADPLQRLELLRELDTKLTDEYRVSIPVITAWVRDSNYVSATQEIYLTEPELEPFLHQFRHHLQNEARKPENKLLLVEGNKDIDSRIPYKDTLYRLYGEDDCIAWSRFIIESI